ncbi:MAG: hypothetical protein ACREE7_18295, partial [Dongiaceae bacterium]
PSPVAASAPAPQALQAPPPAATPVPAADRVAIRLSLTPPNARVELDGLVTTDNPLRLPRSDRVHELVVSAPGYVPAKREIRAILDGEIVVPLEKAAAKPAAARPAPRPAPARPRKPKVKLEEW